MKRIIAPVVGLAVAMLSIVLVAGPASAHDATVRGQAVCNTASGQWDVTWTIANDYGQTVVLSNATRVASQVNGKTLQPVNHSGDTLTAHESVANGSGTLTLKVHGRWQDGFSKDDTGSTSVGSNCVKTKHVSVAASFTDQTCANYQFTPATYSAPDVDGTTKTVTGDTQPGSTLTVAYSANEHVVIDGQSSFSHTYPVHPSAKDCVPPPNCTACHIPAKSGLHSVTCRGILVGGSYQNVNVRQNGNCTLVNVFVNGSVNSNGAHDLTMGNVTVRGSVYASHVNGDVTIGATNSTCSADPMIGGSVIIKGSHNVVLCNLQVCHKIVVKNADGRVMIRESRTNRLVVQHNDRFVKDGSPRHKALAGVRLFHDRAHVLVLGPNKRHLIKRDVHHAARIGGQRGLHPGDVEAVLRA